MRPALALTCLALAAVPAPAQAPKPADKPAPVKRPEVAVPGYKVYAVQGFTVLVQDAVLDVPTDEYEKAPLDVLDGELAVIGRVMTPASVKALRRLVVWAEWDEPAALESGRKGAAVGVYRGGSPAAMVRDGLHPLKSKTVDILSLKTLTAEHQPKRDSGRCVLLHEFAHAVHDQVLAGGAENPQVQAAFAQAMERKLYDKTQYASTNKVEFFAELSCCYLDRLHYFPNSRADLKKHDPVTFKLMEAVWGSSAKKPAAGVTAAAAPSLAGDPKYSRDVRLADVRFGPPLAGPKLDPAELSGKVVLVAYWGGDQANVLDRCAALADDLAGYGLVVVGAYPYTRPDDVVKPEAEARANGFPVVRGAFLRTPGSDRVANEAPPHAVLFDGTGACVFRGSAFAAEAAVRAAVGKKLLATLGDDDPPAGLKAAADALTGGAAPLAAVPKLQAAKASADPATKAAAQQLLDAVLAPQQAALDAATAAAKADPAAAFLAAEKVAAAAKGTPVGGKAAALAGKLRSDKAVQLELRARTALTPITKLHGQLLGRDGSFDPKAPAFRQRNAALLAQFDAAVAEFQRKYPSTKAAEKVAKMAWEFGP